MSHDNERHGHEFARPSGQPPNNSRHRMVGGAKQIAARVQGYYDNTVNPALKRSGAKEFYNNRVVPATKHATQSVQQTVTEQRDRLLSTSVSRSAIVLLIVAILGIVITFLPMGPTSSGRYWSTAVNVVDGNYVGVGGLVVVEVVGIVTALIAATIFRLLLFATIVVAIVAIGWRSPRAKKLAGIVGVVTGLLGVVIGVAALLVTSSLDNMPLGKGTMLLLISAVGIAVTAGVLLRSSRIAALRQSVPPQISSP